MDEEQALADLRHAMALQSAGDVDAALECARRIVARDPAYSAAWAYIGNTLVTRKRRFADGIAALELAVQLRPDDAALWYTLGWCREYAANALARPKGGKVQAGDQLAAAGPDALYQQAKEAMMHALTLDPEPGLRDDIRDILDVIASATGEPWTDEPR